MSGRLGVIGGDMAFGSLVGESADAAASDRSSGAGETRLAQVVPEQPPRRTVRTRPRIEVHPGRLLYRECVDGYREVWRPDWGTSVVMAYMRCWWVRG